MATRLYTPGPSAEECAAIGILPEDVEDNSITEVWEENWLTFQIFLRLRRQWRVGMAGPTGMDYGLLPLLFNRFGVKPKKQPDILDGLQIMEDAALATMAKQMEKPSR